MPKANRSGCFNKTHLEIFANPALNCQVAKTLQSITRVSKDNSFKTYLVGGMVRDIVAYRTTITTSPDITVIGEAEPFADALTDNISGCELIAASQHHTAKIKIGNVITDIASARSDLYQPFGSLPKITLVNDIELDLARRDFTINAMAIPLNPDGHGTLIDPFNGQDDTRNGILRVIRPESFHEDPLRMMRGIRLAARYGYRFNPTSESLISQALGDLSRMTEHSPQRVFNEFQLWFAAHENLDELARLASHYGLLNALGIDADFHRSTFERIPANELDQTRFAAFAYFLSPDTSSSLAQRLSMPSDWNEILQDAVCVSGIAKKCRSNQITDIELYRALIDLQPNVIQSIIHIEHDNHIESRLQDFQTRLRHTKAHLNGEDLIALGIKQGPTIGQLLDELLTLRIEGQITTTDEERQHILNRLNDG